MKKNPLWIWFFALGVFGFAGPTQQLLISGKPAGGGGSTPSLIASVGATVGINGGTTAAINTTGANFAVIVLCWYDAITANPTITDSNGHVWTPLTRAESNDTGVRIYFTQGGTFGPGHTFDVSGSAIYSCMFVQAWNLISSTPFDAENGNVQVVASAIQTGAVAPSQNNVLFVAGTSCNDNGLFPSSINGGFSNLISTTVASGTNVGGGMASLVVVNGATQNPTFTYSGAFNDASATLAAFKF